MFSLSLAEWFFTICLTPYNRKKNVLSAFLNKTFTSFLCFIFKTFLEGYFICIRITHTTVFAYTSHGALAGTRNSSMGPP